MFGLTAQEMEAEPADEFFTNKFILGQIKKKQDSIDRNGPS